MLSHLHAGPFKAPFLQELSDKTHKSLVVAITAANLEPLIITDVVLEDIGLTKLPQDKRMLDGIVGMFAVLNAGQNSFPLDHEFLEVVSAQLNVEQMFHVVDRTICLAHSEMLVNHVEQLPTRHTVSLGLDGLQLLELYLPSEVSGDDSGPRPIWHQGFQAMWVAPKRANGICGGRHTTPPISRRK